MALGCALIGQHALAGPVAEVNAAIGIPAIAPMSETPRAMALRAIRSIEVVLGS